MKKIIFTLFGVGILMFGTIKIYEELNKRSSLIIQSVNNASEVQEVSEVKTTPTISIEPTIVSLVRKEYEVPFTSQAPTGNWENPYFQDGCEEASVLMVMCKLNSNLICSREGNKLAVNFVYDELEKMGEWQTQVFGNGVDTATEDTLSRLVRNFYQSDSGKVIEIKSVEEIINGIERGKIYIVPTDGRLLFNPNFTNGGPERHNLVIKGFDRQEGVFITNDPGTRNGLGYKYKFEILWRAIGDYKTGNHEEIISRPKKVIEFQVETI